MFRSKKMFLYIGLIAVLAFGGFLSVVGSDAAPGNGKPLYRAAQVDANNVVQRAVLLPVGTIAAGSGTQVAGTMVCFQDGPSQFAANLTLTGTMSGTNPTLPIIIQQSMDNGVTWSNDITFTQINATVTPPNQWVSFSDVAASTAITHGDCFRTVYTPGGTSPGGVTFGVKMIAK